MQHNAELYDHDFYTWTQATAALIAAGKWHEIDQARLAEEVAGLRHDEQREVPGACNISSRSCSSGGRYPVRAREQRALASYLENLLVHLLKWRYQPARLQTGHSWREQNI